MPGATLPADYGIADWVNNTDNWREEDAEFIQKRLVIRWASNASRTSSGGNDLGEGSVSYLANSKSLQVNTTGDGNGWSTVVHSKLVTVTDTSTTDVQLKHSSSSAGGIRLYADGVFVDSRLAIGGSNGSPKTVIDGTAGISLNYNGGAGVITTNSTAGGTVVISATNGVSVNKLAVSSTANFTSTVTVASAPINVTGSGSISTPALAVSNSVSPVTIGSGGLTAASGVVSALSFSTTAVGGESYSLANSGLSRTANAALISISNNTPTVSGANIDLKVPSNGVVRFQAGNYSAPVAGWMVSNAVPGSTNAPDGTIWFQV